MSTRKQTEPLPSPDELRTEPMARPPGDDGEDTRDATTKPIHNSEPPIVKPRPSGATEDVLVEDLLRGIAQVREEKPKPRASPEELAKGTQSASHAPVAPPARHKTDPRLDPVQLNVTTPMDDRPRTQSSPETAEALEKPAEPANKPRSVPDVAAAPPPPRRKRREEKTMRVRVKKPVPLPMIAGVVGLAGVGALFVIVLMWRREAPQQASPVVDTNPTSMAPASVTTVGSTPSATAQWVAANPAAASASASSIASASASATPIASASAAVASASAPTATVAPSAASPSATTVAVATPPTATATTAKPLPTATAPATTTEPTPPPKAPASADPDIMLFNPNRK